MQVELIQILHDSEMEVKEIQEGSDASPPSCRTWLKLSEYLEHLYKELEKNLKSESHVGLSKRDKILAEAIQCLTEEHLKIVAFARECSLKQHR